MSIAHFSSLAAAAGWLALTALLFRRPNGGAPRPAAAPAALAAAAMAAHALSLLLQWQAAPRLDFGLAASLFMLTAVVVGWPRARGQREAQLLLAALAGLAAAAPALVFAPRPPPSWETLAHLLPGLLAYAFALTALAQFIHLQAAERRMKSGKADDNAAPILALERACFRTAAIAFVLLTATLATGALQAALTPDFRWWTHKNIFAALTWLVFCVLLIGRRLRGWRGRAARNWALAGFAFLALSYFGSQFVLQVVLGKQ